jgi:hypothetical protein
MAFNPYTNYYANQAGGFQVYSGSSFQKGHGIGSFLRGLWRSVVPMFSSASRAVGNEIMKTTGNIAKDVILKQPWKESVKSRLKEAGSNLNEKFANKVDSLVGNGYKRHRKKRVRHSSTRSGRVRKRKIVRRKKNYLYKDIFA